MNKFPTLGCRHAEGRICENLKYNLQQYKFRGDKAVFKALYEAAMIGPGVVRPHEAEDALGLSINVVTKAMAKRAQLGFPMDFDSEEDTSLEGLGKAVVLKGYNLKHENLKVPFKRKA